MSAPGHVPAYLRDMFCAALAHGESGGAWWEWFGTVDADQFLWRERRGGEWEHLDARARAAWLLDQVSASTAIVPEQHLALHHLEAGQTYADVARRLRPSVAADGDGPVSEAPAERLVPFFAYLPRGLLDALARESGRTGVPPAEITRQALVAYLEGTPDQVTGASDG